MKILELRLKNLNSLYGEWFIDFTDPEFLANGIFALTGPTGSGKSTILDAICLALYGATPRLGRVTSENEIMSRQTGECYAEVVFESQAGRFRCQWRQHRAGKKSAGALQDQHHELADAISGSILQSKKSLVPALVEEKTGMDFDRFTRSILLAQGGFDTFLKANDEQKSSILEQITGTRIYSEISKRVHERNSSETKALELLKAEISGIEQLDDEQEASVQKELAEQQQQEKNLKKQSDTNKQAIEWLNAINLLNHELGQLNTASVELNQAIQDFQPEAQQLKKAQQAALLASDYATLEALRNQEKTETTNLTTATAKLPQLEELTTQQQLEVNATQQKLEKARDQQREAAPLIQQVRNLDHSIAEKKTQLNSATALYSDDEAKLKEQKTALSKQEKLQENVTKLLTQANDYLAKEGKDEWLISNLGAVEVNLQNLERHQQEIFTLQNNLNQAENSVTLSNQQLEEKTKFSTSAEEQLSSADKALQVGIANLNNLLKNRLLREYQAEKDGLLREMAYLNKISDLESQRDQLKDGEACPLCGAEEHPFAQGNVPTPNAVELQITQLNQLIEQANDLEAANKKLEQAKYAAQSQVVNSQNAQQTALNNQVAAQNKLQEVSLLTKQHQAQLKENIQQLINQLQPLGISKISTTQVAELIASLKARLAAWQKQVNQRGIAESQLNSIASEVSRLTGIIETQTFALEKSLEKLKTLEEDLNKLTDERKSLYADKDPTTEEQLLVTAISHAEQASNLAMTEQQRLQQQLGTAQAELKTTQKRLTELQPKVINAEQELLTAAKALGFADEQAFTNARLSQEQLQLLTNKAAQLNETKIDITAKQEDRKKRLNELETKKLTEPSLANASLEELEPKNKVFEEQLENLATIIHGYKHQLKANQEAQEKLKEKQEIITKQTRESMKWRSLHELIGSADGKKFRNFAQGLTFELLIAHANRQLEKMTDRYLLINHPEEPLKLNVVDNYQAGEIRSTKNLSGGESFIVSLTLALGLSKMASDKVQVDSLFLDEGFGTLDEDALDMALETLSSLQEEGKLIGVISHVQALKERISTQITVIPQHGGRSKLQGPGCSAIS